MEFLALSRLGPCWADLDLHQWWPHPTPSLSAALGLMCHQLRQQHSAVSMTSWQVWNWPRGICRNQMVKGCTWHFVILTLNESRKQGSQLRPKESLCVHVYVWLGEGSSSTIVQSSLLSKSQCRLERRMQTLAEARTLWSACLRGWGAVRPRMSLCQLRAVGYRG